MLESDETTQQSTDTDGSAGAAAPRKRVRSTAKKASPAMDAAGGGAAEAGVKPAKATKRAPRKAAAKAADAVESTEPAGSPAVAKAPRKRASKKAAAVSADAADAPSTSGPDAPATEPTLAAPAAVKGGRGGRKAPLAPTFALGGSTDTTPGVEPVPVVAAPAGLVLFQAPAEVVAPPASAGTAADDGGDAEAERPATSSRRRRSTRTASTATAPAADGDPAARDLAVPVPDDLSAEELAELESEADDSPADGARRRRRRGRRGRGSRTTDAAADTGDVDAEASDADADAEVDGPAEADGDSDGDSPTSRRRRRRRRGGDGAAVDDDPPNTVTHVRGQRRGENDEVKGIKGSSRLEAKRQRRRDGRDSSRRRPPILTEAEFLARRESVDRVMAVRQRGDRTQIAIMEDDVLVEHYVTRASATSYVGNVYLGRVQNVLPSMEAAFVDIGKGRNGVLYAGEVNWDAAGLEGKARAIEAAMKSGDALLVQVTKDPIGHKGARLTSQISLPGRFLVYVPGGGMTGISRRLPDTERHRLKAILKKVVPDEAGVIVRTAAEGATEEDLVADVQRLKDEWADIQAKAGRPSDAPALVHGEPDLAIRVVRDVFNEDFQSMVVEGDQAWQQISDYVSGIAPELGERVRKYTGTGELFHDLRVDEQLAKALDRKVWLPSGGSLVIDRTEAMTVIDVNTGKFTGSGGNLEATVTKNNLEAAEEIVRQLRLRDIGGIVVIDFIDMVLESNRDLVLRRLTECLGRDRTKHQVAEVTSLGLVQMTRKRVGEGLLEAFSEPCEVCKGRGVILHSEPIQSRSEPDPAGGREGGGRRSRGKAKAVRVEEEPNHHEAPEQRRAAAAAMAAIAARVEHQPEDLADETYVDVADDDTFGVDGELPSDIEETASLFEFDSVDDDSADSAEALAEEVLDAEPAAVAGSAGPEPVDEPAPVPSASSRPRRRRSASRPAGPPQPVGANA